WALIQSSTPKSANDAWIAACALTYGCTLVTDDNDFHGIQGLNLISHVNEGR
ncbi:MAG: PIN domain-containing protein, partial [Chloroflexi bacterium]|nr:PIN domain-containing protein [Chloroflexota bacterium]